MNPDEILFYGIGSEYVYDMDEVARRAGLDVIAYVDNLQTQADFEGLDPVVQSADLTADHRATPVVIPLVTPGHRKALLAELRELGFRNFASLIDPTAVIAQRSSYGAGLQVNAAVVIAANASFGEQVLINRSASIGHDVRVADYASFGPGCLLCGSVSVGRGAFIGGGATVAPGVSIGDNAIVGAGAVVVRDVPAQTVVAGNPAKVIRENIAGYNDIGV